jgi:hypothetical protein
MTLGPLQADTLDLLTSLSERAIWVRSNCERNVVEVFDGVYQGTDAVHEPGTIWAGRQLTRAQRDHLAALPLTVSVEVDGLGPVLFCHATARDDEEIVLVNSLLAWFADAFVGVEERMVVWAVRICRSTASPTAAASSTPGASACRTGRRARSPTGPCSVRMRSCAAPPTTWERAAAVLRQHLAWPSRVHRREPPERSPSDAEALAIFTRWARERCGL